MPGTEKDLKNEIEIPRHILDFYEKNKDGI